MNINVRISCKLYMWRRNLTNEYRYLSPPYSQLSQWEYLVAHIHNVTIYDSKSQYVQKK